MTISAALFVWKQKPVFVSPSRALDARLHPSRILAFLKKKDTLVLFVDSMLR